MARRDLKFKQIVVGHIGQLYGLDEDGQMWKLFDDRQGWVKVSMETKQ